MASERVLVRWMPPSAGPFPSRAGRTFAWRARICRCCDRRPRRRCHAAPRRKRYRSGPPCWRACGGVRHGVPGGACRWRSPRRRPVFRKQQLLARASLRRPGFRQPAPLLLESGARFPAAVRLSLRCGRGWIPVCPIRRWVWLRRAQPAWAPDVTNVAGPRRAPCLPWVVVPTSTAADSAGACGALRRRDRGHAGCGGRRCAELPHDARRALRDAARCRNAVQPAIA